MGRVDRCRFGWRVSPSNNQNLWPDLEEQKTIRIAKDFAAQGLSYRENPQRLDQLGRPRRGKKWSPGGHGLRRFYSGRAMCLRADWFFRRGARLSTALPGIAQKPMGGQIGCCGVPPCLQPPPHVYWWVFARCSSGSLLGGLNWAGGDRLFLPFDGRFRPDLQVIGFYDRAHSRARLVLPSSRPTLLTTAPQTVLASERKSGRPIRSYQYLAIWQPGKLPHDSLRWSK